jgi:hypothetical protein
MVSCSSSLPCFTFWRHRPSLQSLSRMKQEICCDVKGTNRALVGQILIRGALSFPPRPYPFVAIATEHIDI